MNGMLIGGPKDGMVVSLDRDPHTKNVTVPLLDKVHPGDKNYPSAHYSRGPDSKAGEKRFFSDQIQEQARPLWK